MRRDRLPKLVIVAPAYNEEAGIPAWLESLARSGFSRRIKRVVVVDDGSTDGTAKAIREFCPKLPLKLISYQPNRGPGYAFRKGLTEAIKMAEPKDVIVTMESDNTSDLEILPEMIKKLDQGAGVCVASYYAVGGGVDNVAWWRMIISSMGNLIIRLGCGVKGVKTYSSFYRVFRPAVLKRLSRRTQGRLYYQDGFACMLELLARLSHQGEQLAEVPMVLSWSGRKGVSKMKVIPTALGYLKVVLQYRR